MRILLAISVLTAVFVAAFGEQPAVYRTAVVLKNGTQELFPDSVASRFDIVNRPHGHKAVRVMKAGGSSSTFATDSIAEMNYRASTRYEQFAGDWYLVASPTGEANEQGIMVSQTVSIPYRAVLPAPDSDDYGRYIYCHIDSLPHRKGLKYAVDFRLRYSEDTDSQTGTIALVLDDRMPCCPQEYEGDADTYAYLSANQTFYFGPSPQHAGGDSGHRYQYLLSEDLATQSLTGMELSTQWQFSDQENLDFQYTFTRYYQVYWVVAQDIPFGRDEHDEVGIVDIFSSVRLMRHPWAETPSEP